MKTSVVMTLSVEGCHNWPEAAEIFPEVDFLKHRHRHLFKFKCFFTVLHDDRDIEFIMKKRELEEFIRNRFHDAQTNTCEFGRMSCEMLASFIYENFNHQGRLYKIEVWEDGENGAILEV